MRAKQAAENSGPGVALVVLLKRFENFSAACKAPEDSFTGLVQTLKAVYGSVTYGPQQSSPEGTEQPVARHVSAG
jgi:hypothetical protein